MAEALLQAVDVRVTGVAEPITLTLRAGERAGLLGPVGSGKTALLRTLAYLRAPDSGQIFWEGREVKRRTRWRARRDSIVLVLADPYTLFEESQAVQGMLADPTTALAASGMPGGVQGFEVNTLSGLMRLRLALSHVWESAPRVLLVADVFAHLLPGTAQQVWAALESVVGAEQALLVASHRAEHLAPGKLDTRYILEEGELRRE